MKSFRFILFSLLILPCFSCTKAVKPGSAATIIVNGITEVTAGSCAGPYTIGIEDNSGNNTTYSTNLGILINSSISSTIQFYTDSECQNLTDSLTIPAGDSENVFYFMETVAGSFAININSSLADIQATGIVIPGTTQNVTITTPLTVVYQNECAGPFNVKTTDNYGNLTAIPLVVFFNNGAINAFLDSGCSQNSNAITSTEDPRNPAFFYFLSDSGDEAPVTVTAESLFAPSTLGSIVVPIQNAGI
jgi:hypothetical protein